MKHTAMRTAGIALGLGLLVATALAAAESAGPEPAASGTTAKIPARYEAYAKGLPAEYRGKTNPYKEPTVPLVIKGADTYNARCASCHGLMGFGNGLAAGVLRQQPADLAWSLSSPKVKDDFLYWTIAEGGAPFGSPMPAYKAELKDFEIWEVITYMRAAFEGREASLATPTRHAEAAPAAK
jgi:mono/diheme cytochrome c family protein